MRSLKVCVRTGLLAQALVIATAVAAAPKLAQPPGTPAAVKKAPEIKHRVMESYPNRIQARLEQRARTFRNIAPPQPGMAPHFIINLSKKWDVGQTITVAFKGGDADLRKAIEDTVSEWTKYANLKLDFKDPATGEYRTWAPTDKAFAANIRVSFDQRGYYSLVGNDSINPLVTHPGEESLNLEAFDVQKPDDWKAVALHEFGHAIGFEHEHQSPIAPCDFRFDDDPGYVPTTDQFGQYILDSQGRRPGLYTVLGGPPNNWPEAVVDLNLKKLPPSNAYVVGPFDKDSIMKYFFPAWMFVAGEGSACYTNMENLKISAGDQAGAAKVYPRGPAEIKAASALRMQALEAISKTPGLPPAADQHIKRQIQTTKDAGK